MNLVEEYDNMIRLRKMRYLKLKYVVFLISVFTFLTYLIKNTYRTNSESKIMPQLLPNKKPVKNEHDLGNIDHFYLFPVNLSSQFSIESVRDELSQDQIWLVDSSSQYQKKQQQSTTNSFRNILDGVTKPLLRKKNFLILEYTNVFFQPKFCWSST